MKYLNDLEQSLVIGDMEVFNEFDVSHFISNAKTAITNKAEAVNVNLKFDYYTSMLEKAIQSFSTIKLDNESIKDFLSKFNSFGELDKSPITVKDITLDDDVIIKPQYLNQYIMMVQNEINDFLNGKSDMTSASRFMSSDYPSKVKRQIVKTNLSYTNNMKDLRKETINNCSYVTADTKFVKDKILNFVTKYNTIKSNALTEANATYNAIKESEATVKAMLSALDKMRLSGNIPADKLNILNQLTYNAIRGIIEIISFTSFMIVHKLNVISSNVITCNTLYNNIFNMYGDKSITEAVDTMIVNNDEYTTGEELISGTISAFDILATNIYEFHSGMIDQVVANEVDTDMDYPKDIFDEIVKAYIIISEGLNIIGREGDEYLLVFDDVIQKSGFSLVLVDRFREVIEKINDVSMYNITDDTVEPDVSMYKMMLAEVRNYSDNMSNIASTCHDTFNKLMMLQERFANNVNGEFKDLESTNELKVFMKDLREQFIDMTNTIAKNCMNRLRTLGNKLSELSSMDINNTPEDSTIPIDTSSDIDFSESAFDVMVESLDKEYRNHMKALQLAYYREKTLYSDGLNVIFEAEQPATNTTTNNANNNANSNSTKPVVQDNSTPTQNNNQNNSSNQSSNQQKTSSATIQNLINRVIDFFNKFKDNITNGISNNKDANLKFVQDKINDGILTRSYNNITIQVVKYQGLNENINTANSIVNNIPKTAQEIQALNTQEDVYKKIFPFLNGIDISNAANTKKQMKNYILTGNLNTEPSLSNVSNSAVKSFLEQTAIPYVKGYYETGESSLSSFGENVSKALQTLDGAINTEAPQNSGNQNGSGEVKPAAESVSIFTEAEENTTTSMSQKLGWIQNALFMYTTELASGLQKINNDYLLLMKSIKTGDPKGTTGEAKVSDGNDPQNQPTQTQPVQNNQSNS